VKRNELRQDERLSWTTEPRCWTVPRRVLPLLTPGVKLNPKTTVVDSWTSRRMLRVLSLGLCAWGRHVAPRVHVYRAHVYTARYAYTGWSRKSSLGVKRKSSSRGGEKPRGRRELSLGSAGRQGRDPSHVRRRSLFTPKFDCRPRGAAVKIR